MTGERRREEKNIQRNCRAVHRRFAATVQWRRSLSRTRFCFLLFGMAALTALAVAYSRSWGHSVGEPLLEQLPIWRQCCNEHDCIPQQVSILRREEKTMLVDIAGFQTSVDKDKFSPVPSTRTFVCYLAPKGPVTNDNIRCILHPQPGGVM